MMKRISFILLVGVGTFSLISADVLAWNTNNQNQSWNANNQNHPCEQIKASCSGAGYFKGGYKQGKGLWKNCFNPLLAGQAVSGVSVDPAVIQACQAKRAQKQFH